MCESVNVCVWKTDRFRVQLIIQNHQNMVGAKCKNLPRNHKAYTHMKSYFPKGKKRHSQKWVCNFNANFVDYVLGKGLCIYIYLKIGGFFSNVRSSNLVFAKRTHVLNQRLSFFLNSSSYIHAHITCICRYAHVNLFIHIHTNICTYNLYGHTCIQ